LLKIITMGSITIPGSSPTSATVYRYWKSGTSEYRQGIRNNKLYVDKLKSGGSWDEAEGVGWDVVGMYQ
jgi:hypothetical protein